MSLAATFTHTWQACEFILAFNWELLFNYDLQYGRVELRYSGASTNDTGLFIMYVLVGFNHCCELKIRGNYRWPSKGNRGSRRSR
jgi:hypothetical protein